jgi:hypothetical protein
MFRKRLTSEQEYYDGNPLFVARQREPIRVKRHAACLSFTSLIWPRVDLLVVPPEIPPQYTQLLPITKMARSNPFDRR